MKNAIVWGIIIGVLSGLWMFTMHQLGITPSTDKVATAEYFSFLIPAIGLFFGIRSYRAHDCKGQMGFLEALVQSFKILIVGGIIAVFGAILYISYIAEGNNIRDFSGRIFGALLVGVLLAFGVSLLFHNKSNKVD
ncbi:DUF4199 domain-containing protein [Mucilaginibacter sabulilitoris]|uniref:DUF4199 domain-containing protein n=1 Tax=Mucilaginibacter sabulilitoris TaxID=1173583 RepID=A0ABZ0TQC6_9SPHI|nr:DUF4199 domain-containing protein [Mucilaginibacter sabulilitoris]WPU94388.1 DUF4199 domain-containing protein [Mucilaginibacter sabulilitoris]